MVGGRLLGGIRPSDGNGKEMIRYQSRELILIETGLRQRRRWTVLLLAMLLYKMMKCWH